MVMVVEITTNRSLAEIILCDNCSASHVTPAGGDAGVSCHGECAVPHRF